MATRTSKADKALDTLIERIYYANCRGVQINIMDIGKIFAAGRAAAAEGEDAITAAVLGAVAVLRKN